MLCGLIKKNGGSRVKLIHMCKGVTVMDDRGRKITKAASIHGLDCLESKEQGEAQPSS